jgi:hypothetical protein
MGIGREFDRARVGVSGPRLQYTGWVGCEYKPLQSTLAGLGWANSYGIGISSPILSTSQNVS